MEPKPELMTLEEWKASTRLFLKRIMADRTEEEREVVFANWLAWMEHGQVGVSDAT